MLAVARFGFQSRVIADLVIRNPASVTRWLNTGLRMKRDDTEYRSRIDTTTRLISAPEANNATMRNVALQHPDIAKTRELLEPARSGSDH